MLPAESGRSPSPQGVVSPFGYPRPQQRPLKHNQLSQDGPPAGLLAITDVDKGNVTDPTVGGGATCRICRCMGAFATSFFDWHPWRQSKRPWTPRENEEATRNGLPQGSTTHHSTLHMKRRFLCIEHITSPPVGRLPGAGSPPAGVRPELSDHGSQRAQATASGWPMGLTLPGMWWAITGGQTFFPWTLFGIMTAQTPTSES